MSIELRGAGILGTGSYTPEKILTNFDFEKFVDTTDEWIVTRTGIRQRHIAEEGMAASDLACNAATRALESAGIGAEKIDLIICATITGDMPFPSTSCILQNRIGAVGAGAFDLQAGCSGWVYALTVATQFIKTGIYNHILVVGVDVLSRLTDFTDRSTCVLFGDGAGAAVLGPVAKGEGVLATCLGADGSGAELLKVEAGGSRLPASEETVKNRRHYIKMEGREVYKFAVKIMVEASIKALGECSLTPEDVDLFIPHQANERIIDAARDRLKIPAEKVFKNVANYGNTSAASIPIALDEAHRSGRIKAGDVVVAVGFGAGLTWASAALKWVVPAK
ncbi:MAG: beta-ketoacyl-ACP synthase III [Armatimonadota bacterium]|jgi:3-oxoacyl-[acyl-carrier-protein] synthase-3|nr:3-oxoacyl-ACP synthase [Armatimonadota bacterium]